MKFKHPKKIKRTIAGLVAGIILSLLGLLLPYNFLHRAEYIFYDAFLRHEATHVETHSDDIFVVDIDENSLTKYGPYNEWTRDMHAKVVEKLEEGGAAAIAFDILFKNADFGNRSAVRAEQMLNELYPGKNWRFDFDKIRQKYDYDSILVRSIADQPNVIVSGTFSSRTDYKHQSQWMPLSTSLRARDIDAHPTFKPDQADHPENIEQKDLLDNVFSELSQSANHFGVVNATPDPDGVLRRMRLFYRFPNADIWPRDPQKIYPIFSISTLMYLFQTDPDSVKIELGKYVDLGKPLGVYRDSLGILRTTYPQFTVPMIREMVQHKDILRQTKIDEATGKSFMEITPQIRAVKDTNGNVMILTDEGDFEINDEDLTDYDHETITAFKPAIDKLKNGESMWISAALDFHFDNNKGYWRSNFSFLTPDVLEDLYNTDPNILYALKRGEMLRFGKPRRIPIDENGDFLVHFKSVYNSQASNRTFQHLSYYDVIEGRIPPDAFQGKIFILGSAAPAMFDFYAAPHEDHFPAVLVHASIIGNVLNNDYILSDFPHPPMYVITALLAILIGLFASQYFAFIGLIILILINIITSSFCFKYGYYIGCTTYIIDAILAFLGSFFIRFYFENRDKTFLDKSFKQYISNELIDQMLSNEELPKLGGEKKYLTAYFTDIQGFSSFSEQIGDPENLVVLLNSYLTSMTNIIKDKNQGTLDKYEGDAIIAFFGAPTPLENQRRHALLSALAMQKQQQELRVHWMADSMNGKADWPDSVFKMHTRIGINSGDIVVGNMGSETRKNYTMMGDAVNLASRLESIAKQYGVYVLVSEEVLTGSGDPNDKMDYREEFITRPIDRLRVVGKKEPVQVYEVLARNDDKNAGQLILLQTLWKKAQAFYYDEKWDEAIALFKEAALLEPHSIIKDPGSHTTPSEVFIARCKAYKIKAPQSDGPVWDGVYVATTK